VTAANPLDPHAGQPVNTVGPLLSPKARVAILVHGRNAGPENILDLATHLARPGITYLAPAAAGRTWYPLSFLAPRAQNEPSLSSALAALGRVVDEAVLRGVPTRRIAIIGFSQGACLATEFVYRCPERLGALIAFTGGLIGPAGTTWDRTTSFTEMPAFFGCSDVDAHVPRARVEESAGIFATLGARVTPVIYPGMGHLINDDEVVHARQILDEIGPAR
jgi:predicted esterase